MPAFLWLVKVRLGFAALLRIGAVGMPLPVSPGMPGQTKQYLAVIMLMAVWMIMVTMIFNEWATCMGGLIGPQTVFSY